MQTLIFCLLCVFFFLLGAVGLLMPGAALIVCAVVLGILLVRVVFTK